MTTKATFIQCLPKHATGRQRYSQFVTCRPFLSPSCHEIRLQGAWTRRPSHGVASMRVDLGQEHRSEKVQVTSEAGHANANGPLTMARYGLGAVYVGFMVFALFLGPGSWNEPGELGQILSRKLDSTNDLFFAIFNLTTAASVNLAALLNPGASRQSKMSPEVFSLAGLFIGFAALGPYIVGRDYVPESTAEEVQDRGVISRIFEGRLLAVGTMLFAVWTYAFALGFFTPGTLQFHDVVLYASAVDLFRILSNDRWACVTCLDLIILCIAIWGPLTEDMRRRGWFVPGKTLDSVLTALSFMLVPVVGPALYLILRPQLPSRDRKQST